MVFFKIKLKVLEKNKKKKASCIFYFSETWISISWSYKPSISK